jgi:signal transduction histidine kinase/ligand-binding sensor domain-containing protein/CheY-like chemotaxis protein
MRYKNKLRRLFLWLILFPIYLVLGNENNVIAEKPLELYKQTVYTSEDGLPQNSIFFITQTPDGFIWLATNAGIARFDGIEFDVFDRKNTPALINDVSEFLLVDQGGVLWIATRKGGFTCCKNGIFEKSYTTKDGLVSNDVRAILTSHDGSKWIATAGGLNRLERGKISAPHFTGSVVPRDILNLAEDSRGYLWIGTYNGLLVAAKTETGKYSIERAGFDGEFISALEIDRENRLWVGTNVSGLFRLEWAHGDDPVPARQGQSAWQWDRQFSFTTENGLSSNLISALYLDRDGIVWIGTQSGGLNRLQGDHVSVFDVGVGLSHSYVSSVFKDREGNLWIGTNGGGLNLLRDSKIATYTTKNGLSYDQVYGIYEDSQGCVWIGTFGFGVNCIKNGRVHRRLTRENGFPTNFVLTICELPEGNMWFGTYGDGIVRMNMKDGHFKTYNTRDGLISNFVYGLYVDRKGQLWAGTNDGGLHRFSHGRFILHKRLQGKVRAFLEDSRGYLWVGTDIMGVIRIKGQESEVLDMARGMSSNDIMAIFEDKTGAVWIATYGGGINRYTYADNRIKAVKQEDGLLHDIIYWILADHSDNLWMSSMSGIFRVSRGELDAFFNGRSRFVTCTVYDEADGMKVKECNGGSQASGWRTRDGRLWFITAAGTAVVDVYPVDKTVKTLPPPVVINQVTIDGKTYNPLFPAAAPPGKGDVEVQYTAASFIVPERVRFKYKLEGYDDDWVNPGSRREAFYTNLPHGSYTFRAKACNHEGTWNEQGASLRFTIAPYLWETWWFRIPAAVSVLFLIRLLFILNMRNIKKRQQELEHQVAERTQHLKKQTVELENKRATLEKINNIVKAINEQVDHRDIMVSILRESAVLEGIDRAAALVFDNTRDVYTFKAASGYDVDKVEFLRFTRQEVEDRYIKGSGEIFKDIFIAKNLEGRPAEEKVKGLGIPESMLIMKVQAEEGEGAPAGYLLFEHMTDENAFDKQDIQLLKELRDHIASAFIKSKLLLELEAKRGAAEAANYSKSLFLARMSHEIRTPMNSVIGFADMLKDTDLNEEQREYIRNITRSGEALLNLIDEILDFSKIEAGKLSFQPIDFDLEAAAFDVCRQMQPHLEGKPVEILCRIGGRVPAYVRSDAGRIRQVLINLMGNAVKFTEAGEIELSVDIEEKTHERLKLHARVRDTGIGISKDQLKHIFELFQQADGSVTRKYGGTGLGLAISRQIALLMGGDIWVESQVGKGSTFHFTAWLEKSAKEPAKGPFLECPDNKKVLLKEEDREKVEEAGHSVRILLAEDNPINQKLARFMLTKGGYGLDVVNNGKEAVETFTNDPGKFDLIFMDVNMPEMDGREAARVIREKGFTEIPIIAMTAYAMKEDREKCLEAGMNDYISKPIKRDIMFEMVHKWVLKTNHP